MHVMSQYVYPMLSNGEIEVPIVFTRYDCGVRLPDGVVFGQDSNGNYYLNGKPAHIRYKIVKGVY